MPIRPHLVVSTEREARRLEILSGYELARAQGLPYGTDGYTGMPGRLEDGSLAPPGRGETIRATEAVLLSDGRWAMPVHLRLRTRDGGRFDLSTMAGREVVTREGRERMPAIEDIDTDTYARVLNDEGELVDSPHKIAADRPVRR